MKLFVRLNAISPILLCVIVLTSMMIVHPLWAKDYTTKSYQLECQNATPTTDIVEIFKDYIQHAEDVGVLRKVQNDWLALDSANVAAYFRKLRDDNPKSPKYLYLYGRVAPSNLEKIKIGRTVISLDPKYPYGYRLVCTSYEKLFAGTEKAADATQLQSELDKDGSLFATWVSLDKSDATPSLFQFNYLLYKKDLKAARTMFESAKADTSVKWATMDKECDLLVREGKSGEALDKLRMYYHSLPSEQGGNEEGNISDTYIASLRRFGEYGKVIEYLKTSKRAAWASTLYDLACYSALDKKADDAFHFLNQALDSGYTGLYAVKTDLDLESLRTDSRWKNFVDKMDASKTQSIAKAREGLAKTIISKDAPDWTLVGVNGDSVRLSSLRGQVVVLDFWATWCNPCRMAMPLVDQYMRTAMPKEGVRVFSINVWEAPAQKAKIFMKNKGYAMTLLFGNNDLSKAYGIGGIPYLCIIDKNGKIRYEEDGYTPELENLLPLWVEDLLAK